MSNLTEKNHWDFVHLAEEQRLLNSPERQSGPPSRWSASRGAVHSVKKLLGPARLEKMSGYDDYLLWKVIIPKHVPRLNGAPVVEIGSAPGHYVIRFSGNRDCTPYGIEYSEVGVKVNREMFTQRGYNPDNVIHADIFSKELDGRYKEQFDAVISKGFIEHFENLKPVIDRHLTLLKPGGYLVVTVPNLRGFNNLLARFFDETAIPRHNTRIMRRNAYRALFDRPDLEPLFCDYYGTFSFYLFTAGRSAIRRTSTKAAHKLQPLLNFAFRSLFGAKGAESGFFSPYLMFVGRKLG